MNEYHSGDGEQAWETWSRLEGPIIVDELLKEVDETVDGH